MKHYRRHAVVLAVVFAFTCAGLANAFGVGNVDGVWQYVEDGGDESATCDGWATMTGSSWPWSTTNPTIQNSGGNVTDENQVRYGVPTNENSCPNERSEFLKQSGFGFNGVDGAVSIEMDEPFYLGSFTHYNNPISGSNLNYLNWVDLTVTVPVDCDDNGSTDTTFTMYPRFNLDETNNNASPCPYLPGDQVNINGCADRVLIEQPANPTFTCSGVPYTVNIYGFTSNANCSTVFDASAVSAQYITKERATNTACLWAEIDAPIADAAVSKSCTGFDNSGDPHYMVTVTNAGPGTALGAKIVDTLPAGVTYVSATSMRTVNGVATAQGSCSAAGQTLTCNLNAALSETTSDPTSKWVVDINVNYTGNPGWTNSVVLSTTSVDTNSANNTSSATCDPPLAVKMLRFDANAARGGITIAWETASEADNLGFNIYRAETLDGERAKLNPELIATMAPPAAPTGAAYEYADQGVVGARTYFYWLEQVDIRGAVELQGPVAARTLVVTKLPLVQR